MEYTELELPIASNDVISFIDAVPLIESQKLPALIKLNEDISFLEELKTTYLINIYREINAIMENSQNQFIDFKTNQNSLIFARKKYQKLFFKYHKIRLSKFNNHLKVIKELINYLKECRDNKIPVSFIKEQFLIQYSLEDDKELLRYSWKIVRISTWAKNNLSLQLSQVTPLQLISMLLKQAENVDENIEYIKMNDFDEMLFEYVKQTGLIDKFEIIVKKMPLFNIKQDNQLFKTNYETLNDFSTFLQSEEKENVENFIFNHSDFFQSLLTKDGNNLDELDQLNSFKDLQNIKNQFERNLNFNEMVVSSSSFYDYHCSNTNLTVNFIPPPLVFDVDESYNYIETTFSLAEFDSFVKFFFAILDSTDLMDNKKNFIVMKCALIRILFHLYFQQNYKLFYGNYERRNFLLSCEEIIHMIPFDLGINDQIFKNTSFETMEIKDILTFNNNSFFLNAINSFTLFQFYDNPLDIAFLCYSIIKDIKDGLQILLKTKNTIELSFDDLFSFFISCLSMNSLTIPLHLHKFMNSFDDIKMSDPLIHSKTCLTASIKHLIEK